MAKLLPSRISMQIKHWLGRTIPESHLPDAPYFNPPEYGFWKANVTAAQLYLEYGSGGSTIEAARLERKTVTVENDIHYAKAVRRKASLSPGSEIITVDLGPVLKWGTPYLTKRTPRRLRLWKKYSTAPWEKVASLGHFPDFILIDGRFRRACMLEVLSHAHRQSASTVIMFDDYYMDGRHHYHVIEQFAGSPERVGDAAIWRIGNGLVKKVPLPADITEANADFR